MVVTAVRAVIISICQRCGPLGTSTAESTANSLRLAGKSITSLLTTAEMSTLSFELLHGDGRQLGSSMMLGFILVYFVDRDGCVHNGWLDSLLLDDRLNVLVNVVMNVLTCNRGICGGGMLRLASCASILELCLLSGKAVLDVVVIAVLEMFVLDTDYIMGVLLWKHLLVLNGLHRGMVVILVDFTINSLSDIIMVGTSYILVGNSWVDSLMNSGVMLPILGKETRNCSLGFIHSD